MCRPYLTRAMSTHIFAGEMSPGRLTTLGLTAVIDSRRAAGGSQGRLGFNARMAQCACCRFAWRRRSFCACHPDGHCCWASAAYGRHECCQASHDAVFGALRRLAYRQLGRSRAVSRGCASIQTQAEQKGSARCGRRRESRGQEAKSSILADRLHRRHPLRRRMRTWGYRRGVVHLPFGITVGSEHSALP